MPDTTLHTVPTELERQDAFLDGAVLAGTILVAWYFALQGVLWLIGPILPVVALWTLTGESVADVPFLGAVSAGLRNLLGLRRADEWAFAWAHYLRVGPLRRFRAWWQSSPSKPVQVQPLAPTPAQGVKAILEVWPTTNYQLASPTERSDQMEALARVLMGLSYPVQVISRVRETAGHEDWPRPPRLRRQWLVVITAPDQGALTWRIRTMRDALEAVGLRCTEYGDIEIHEPMLPESPGVVRAGENLYSSVVLRRWPREVAPGWLGQALAADLAVDVAIHFMPQDSQRIARFLRRQQSWQAEANANTPDAGNELGRADAERVRLKLIARIDRPCKAAVVLTVHANDHTTLRARLETLGHEIGLTLGDARPATFEQDRALDATRPHGRCTLRGAWRTLDCTSVASTWLFQPATVTHSTGADIGTTHDGSMLVRLSPFDMSLESFGGIVLAKVGAGKSFLLKLLARRLEGVEVLIVEQRVPAEYTGVVGAHAFNLADVPYGERADRLRTFVSDLWSKARSDPRPRLLILDELWSLLRDPALAALIEEIARIGRHHYLSLWIATQQVTELLDDRGGKAVLDNAAIRIYLKQHDRDLEKLCDAVGLSAPSRRFLRSASRGQALLDVGGMLVPVDIQAAKDEAMLITTDPREVQHGLGSQTSEDQPLGRRLVLAGLGGLGDLDGDHRAVVAVGE